MDTEFVCVDCGGRYPPEWMEKYNQAEITGIMMIGKIIPLKDEDESNAVQQKLLDAGYQTVGGTKNKIKGEVIALCIGNDPEDGPWFAGIIPGSSLEFYETITVEDAIGLIDGKKTGGQSAGKGSGR